MISIIIPTFNRANMISETIESLLAQSYKNWECIIVDDESTDGTETLINNYNFFDKRIRYYKRPQTLKNGPSSCRNFGFEKSTGDYIHFMDSDDKYFAEALTTYMENISSRPDVVVAEVELVDYKTGQTIRKNKILSPDLIEDYLQGKISFFVSGPFWKKEFLNKQPQLFDPEIRNLDDWDFNLRMLYRKPKIKYIEKPLIQYRIHSDSLSQEINSLNMNEINSEIFTRQKHWNLIKSNNLGDSKILKSYLLRRTRFFLKTSLIYNSPYNDKLFKLFFFTHLKCLSLINIPRYSIAYLSYKVFRRGYIFLK